MKETEEEIRTVLAAAVQDELVLVHGERGAVLRGGKLATVRHARPLELRLKGMTALTYLFIL